MHDVSQLTALLRIIAIVGGALLLLCFIACVFDDTGRAIRKAWPQIAISPSDTKKVKPPSASRPWPKAEVEDWTAEAVLQWAEVRNLSPDVYSTLSDIVAGLKDAALTASDISSIVKGEPVGSPLPSDFRSLVKHYEKAVLSGTATPSDFRKIETAIKRSLS